MDVHRARFVPYPSSAINALAFSHSSNSQSNDDDVRLAVGRANGDIEIWNPLGGAWVQEIIFHSGKDRSVEDLAWTQEPDDVDENGKGIPGQLRLFSIGYSSSITEWSLATGLPLRHSSGNSSEVWCMAAQPRLPASSSNINPDVEASRTQNIVAGCADGTIALLGTENNDLQFMRYLTRPNHKRARCLSITWQNRDVVVAGFADSTVRVYSKESTLLRTISLGAGPVKGPKEILVWSVKCLPNGDIVSGDSTGDIRFYDGKYFSQVQRVSGHETDCLAVAVSQDGQTVFSTGPDRRLATYKLGPSNEASKRRWWAKTSHQRHHAHDVKVLASYESAELSVLASGGVDTNLIINPIRGYGEENGRTISGLPQRQDVCSTSNRLLASWWDREVWIWQMQRSTRNADPHKLLSKIVLKGEASIASVSVASNGSLLAIATAEEVRLFNLRIRGIQPVQTLRTRKLEAPKTLQARGARLVRLSEDGKWLAVVRQDNEIQIYRIIQDDASSGGHRVITSAQELPCAPRRNADSERGQGLGLYKESVTRLHFSIDGHCLVAGNLSGYIDSWLLAGHEDITAPEADLVEDEHSDESMEASDDEEIQKVVFLGQTWTPNPSSQLLPRLEAAPLILTFRPSPPTSQLEPNGNPALHATRHNPHPLPHDISTGSYRLIVVTAKHQLREFDLLSSQITKWSRQNPPSRFPTSFTSIRDRVSGATWHMTESWQRLWLHGSNWVFMFDLSQDLETYRNESLDDASSHKKRKRDNETRQLQKNTSGAGSKSRRERDADSNEKRVHLANDASVSNGTGHASFREVSEGFDEMEEDGSDTNGLEALPGRHDVDSSDDEAQPQPVQPDDGPSKAPAKTWHTFKYRPILGMVPLSSEVDMEARRDEDVLEVVLIERPSWDLDLPPRFAGVHERG